MRQEIKIAMVNGVMAGITEAVAVQTKLASDSDRTDELVKIKRGAERMLKLIDGLDNP
jgi:hypothetical protein